MTNKELIDHCNNFWGVWSFLGIWYYCDACPYGNICDIFRAKYHDTPYREDHFHDGRYYTEEEIEV